MKKRFIALAVGAGLAFHSDAQTNGYATNSLSLGKSQIEIFSDRAEFDLKANLAVYRGHVRVAEPKLRMACETLTARLPERGGRVDSIVAEGRVVIDLTDDKGQTVHGTGDKAVYTYAASNTETNEAIELTGNPLLETAQGNLTGDAIIYDRITGKLKATNQKMIVHEAVITNAPPGVSVTTNAPASP